MYTTERLYMGLLAALIGRINTMRFPEFQPEQIPAGKRTVRANVWGNVNAYVGRRFWATLGQQYAVGTDEAVANFLKEE